MINNIVNIQSVIYSNFFSLAGHLTSKSLLQKMKLFHNRYRSRRQLLKLDDSRLADIGLSREAAKKEAQKPFWQ